MELPKEEPIAQTLIARLLYLFTGLYERFHNEVETFFERWKDEMESRRPPLDELGEEERQRELPYRLRKLEGNIDEQEHWRLRLRDYHESGEKKDTSWQTWILGIVAVLIVAMLMWTLGKLDTLGQQVATLEATQAMGLANMSQRQSSDEANTSQRQSADEQRIDRMEARILQQSAK